VAIDLKNLFEILHLADDLRLDANYVIWNNLYNVQLQLHRKGLS
jgi:hypothetical protein